jgi:hypothetical protein
MPSFDSTAITRAEYDSDRAVLSLWFTGSGGPYAYFLVPRRVFEGLCDAPSKGGYYNRHIRDTYRSEPPGEPR